MAVIAVQQIRRMRGGAQSHLMLASDGNLYVVKFRNNPQHIRVLANELLATRLGTAIGLSVPHSEIIEVTDWLIRNTPDLHMEFRGGAQPCLAGLHFASRWVGGLMPGQVVDYLPEEQLLEVRNLREFAGILALDKWTCNINGRQAVFQKRRRERRYLATFIDQGYCFHAGDWKFVDASLGGVFAENTVYRGVTGWQSFEPWLSRIEQPGPGDGLGDCGDHSARVVRGRFECPGSPAGAVTGAPRTCPGVDWGVQGIGAKAVSELERRGGRGVGRWGGGGDVGTR